MCFYSLVFCVGIAFFSSFVNFDPQDLNMSWTKPVGFGVIQL